MTTGRYVGIVGVVSGGLTIALLLSLVISSPAGIGPVGVTIWFILSLGAVSGLTTLVLYFAKTFLRLHQTAQARLRYSWRQGWLIGGWMTSLLALSSLGQLGIKDALLLGLLLLIVEGYVRLRWP